MLVLNMAHFLPSAGVGDEARVQYKQTSHALDEFMRKCFNEWTFSLENVKNFKNSIEYSKISIILISKGSIEIFRGSTIKKKHRS
jgi:hypothetical protein